MDGAGSRVMGRIIISEIGERSRHGNGMGEESARSLIADSVRRQRQMGWWIMDDTLDTQQGRVPDEI